jgi:hypothetical protein
LKHVGAINIHIFFRKNKCGALWGEKFKPQKVVRYGAFGALWGGALLVQVLLV